MLAACCGMEGDIVERNNVPPRQQAGRSYSGSKLPTVRGLPMLPGIRVDKNASTVLNQRPLPPSAFQHQIAASSPNPPATKTPHDPAPIAPHHEQLPHPPPTAPAHDRRRIRRAVCHPRGCRRSGQVRPTRRKAGKHRRASHRAGPLPGGAGRWQSHAAGAPAARNARNRRARGRWRSGRIRGGGGGGANGGQDHAGRALRLPRRTVDRRAGAARLSDPRG